jgi:signal transduction histidine kinase
MMNLNRPAPASFLYSLRGRLLFLICLSTLPAILFTFLVAENERTVALVRTERDALHLAELASREHSHQIKGAHELLSWLGAKLAREGEQSPIITDPDFFRALLAGHPQLGNIGVLSPDGRVLTSAYPLSSYRSWQDNPAFLAALRSIDVVTGKYIISPIFDRPTLNHAYAIRNADEEVFAVLFNGLDLDWLSDMARQSNLPDGYSLIIADRDGRVLAWGGPEHPGIPEMEGVRIPGIPELSQSQRGRMLELHGAGVERYFVAVPLEEASGLFAAVGLPYDQVLQRANASFYRTIFGLGVLTLFTIAAVFIAAELGILRGVRSLARAAQRFGAGDLSARAKVPRSHNEFSSLATAFNTMADSLEARHREAVDTQARLRALASHLQIARESEAERISRELHDEIGQVLTSIKIDLSRLQLHCIPSEPASPCSMALREAVAMMNKQIDTAVDFVRRIASDLRPGVLDKLGLTAALEWQAHEIETRTELVVQVEADDVDQYLDGPLSVTLFRIAQETLNNVVLHAQARVVEIILVATGGNIVLTIHDDGKGITSDSIESSESLGIIGMRERAMLINGHLSIHAAPGKGTTVSVTVSLPSTMQVTHAHFTG